MTTNNWLWIAAAVIATALLSTAIMYDVGGVFSSPGLMQE